MTQPSTNLVESTVAEVAALEAQERGEETRFEHVAGEVTRHTGNVAFVFSNALFFTVWIVINLPASPLQFDAFPFSFLTMIVSLEAIFLAIFVLISENAQARTSDRRARLDMQVNVIAEREVTKILEMVAAIQDHLGLTDTGDEELRDMRRRTRISHVAQTVEHANSEARGQDGTRSTEE